MHSTKFFLRHKTVLIPLILLILAFLIFENLPTPIKPKLGVSFSPNYAQELGLDWKAVYLASLDELQIRQFRIPTYWKNIEKEPGVYNFEDVDFMLDEAQKRDAKVLLVVGVKQPRWPECHAPLWAKRLSTDQKREKILNFVTQTVQRYKNHPSIWGWQVENEPLFEFGSGCDKPDKQFLQQEIDLVKRLDPLHPVILTDTGEWSLWTDSMRLSDMLGISLYRSAYNKILGYYDYPFPISMYKLKYILIKNLFAQKNQKVFVSELQAEPWVEGSIPESSLDEQIKRFPILQFKNNVEYAQKTGFEEVYLWGVEWWYYANLRGYPQYWEYAKTLFE